MEYMFSLAAWGVLALICLWFLLVAYRDLRLLLPVSGLKGTGTGRVWAVARTTVMEAWSWRVWAIILLWVILCAILVSVIRPYDETERLPMYLSTLLRSQEYMVLLMVGILACISLPRERESKTIITTGTKPVSRLELFLGKVVGFSTVAFLLLAVMTMFSFAFLYISDWKVRKEAATLYAQQQTDFKSPVQESLKRLSEEGDLHALNYVTAKGGMQIAGGIRYIGDKAYRVIKGGSTEQIIFKFTYLPEAAVEPSFFFSFTGEVAPGYQELPANIQLNVKLELVKPNPNMRPEEKTITLRRVDDNPKVTRLVYQWRPEQETGWFAIVDTGGVEQDPGPVQVTITCPTKGVLLVMNEDPNANNNAVNMACVDLDATRTRTLPDKEGKTKLTGRDFALADALAVTRGFESRGEEQVEAASDPGDFSEVASFRFRDIDPNDIPLDKDGNFTMELIASVDKQKNPTIDTMAQIDAYSIYAPSDKDRVTLPEVKIQEKRVTEIKLPARLLNNTDFIVDVRSATPGHWIGLKDDRLRLAQKPGWFPLNFIKSELIIFSEVVLLVIIAVACSVRLGWPVAILSAATCYLLGNLFDYVHEMSHGNTFDLFNSVQLHDYEQFWWFRWIEHLCSIFTKALFLMVNAVPDFTKFDAMKYISESRDMPLLALAVNFGYAFLYALPFIAIGYLLIRKQELA